MQKLPLKKRNRVFDTIPILSSHNTIWLHVFVLLNKTKSNEQKSEILNTVYFVIYFVTGIYFCSKVL